MPHTRRTRPASTSHSRRAEADLRMCAEALSAEVDERFLVRLAGRLAAILPAEYVEIAEITSGPERSVRPVALVAHGEEVAGVDYALRDTPGERVLEGGCCYFSSDVQNAFPHAGLLPQMGVNAYAGIPLVDSFGRILGLMAAMDSRQFPAPRRSEVILRLFAGRAALELERQRADRLLLNAILDRVGAPGFVTTDSSGPGAA